MLNEPGQVASCMTLVPFSLLVNSGSQFSWASCLGCIAISMIADFGGLWGYRQAMVSSFIAMVSCCMNCVACMGPLPDTQNCGLHWHALGMPGTFSPPPISKETASYSDPGMHHGTCVSRVPWCMSGSLTRGGGENVPGIPGACATRDFAYLVRGPWNELCNYCFLYRIWRWYYQCRGCHTEAQ